jgi:hypothetical protein
MLPLEDGHPGGSSLPTFRGLDCAAKLPVVRWFIEVDQNQKGLESQNAQTSRSKLFPAGWVVTRSLSQHRAEDVQKETYLFRNSLAWSKSVGTWCYVPGRFSKQPGHALRGQHARPDGHPPWESCFIQLWEGPIRPPPASKACCSSSPSQTRTGGYITLLTNLHPHWSATTDSSETVASSRDPQAPGHRASLPLHKETEQPWV